MPKRIITERKKGEKEEEPEVIVVYHGVEPLVWDNQNYAGDGDTMEFTLEPEVKETFPREYAKRIFGDWELPKKTKAERKEWADMVKDRVDRSPTCDGKLPMVVIFEQNGTELWDGPAEFSEWFERHGLKMLPRPDTKGSGIKFEMPVILKEADAATLRKLFEHAFGCKMPAGMKHEDAKKVLLAKLTPEQIADVLVDEFKVEPDMSQYETAKR